MIEAGGDRHVVKFPKINWPVVAACLFLFSSKAMATGSVGGDLIPVTGIGTFAVTPASGTWTVSDSSSASVNKSSVTVFNSSVQIFAANSNRTGLECISLCTNSLSVYLDLDSTAATTDFELEACSSWEPPSTTVFKGALSAIGTSAASGQTIRCFEYQP